jgi:hypothetical protein
MQDVSSGQMKPSNPKDSSPKVMLFCPNHCQRKKGEGQLSMALDWILVL